MVQKVLNGKWRKIIDWVKKHPIIKPFLSLAILISLVMVLSIVENPYAKVFVNFR